MWALWNCSTVWFVRNWEGWKKSWLVEWMYWRIMGNVVERLILYQRWKKRGRGSNMSNVETSLSKLMWLCHCAHSVESHTGKRAEDYKIILYKLLPLCSWIQHLGSWIWICLHVSLGCWRLPGMKLNLLKYWVLSVLQRTLRGY